MLFADISMELPLDQIIGLNEDLLTVGASYARDIHALCTDVAAVIFPTAIIPPTDAVISAVTSKLVQLVTDIECRLQALDNDEERSPATWPLLAQSGFLREADLVDFILARVAEDRFEARLDNAIAVLPVQLLDHGDAKIAEAAQILLAADSLHRRPLGRTYLALPAELLHKLCWRVVAALEIYHGSRSQDIIASARDIIASYDEGQTTTAAAHKIIHFADASDQTALLKPESAGLHLYVAAVSVALNIDHDHVLRLINAGSSAPYAVILKALGLPKEEALASIFLLRGELLKPREAGIFEHGYGALDQHTALAELSSWSMTRAQFLAFGK
jgi:hypothetical protein